MPAKVTQPILVNYHPRMRLFELLDKCWEYPVIWISGPAGCGKTTLAGSYLKNRKTRSLWYQVDEGDADPATFFYYMRQATRHIAPRKKNILPLMTPEYHPGLAHFTMRYFEQLFKSMPEHSVIVLDNYQEAPETSTFQIVIRQGLSVIPRGLHVLLISRKPPPAELVRLEANRQMATIGWNELRLMSEETTGIVELLAPDYLDQDKIDELHSLAGGWVAGVVLMMHKFLTEGVEPDAFDKKTHELIFDYFASEVFERMDPNTQVFLLKSAFLSHMSIALALEFTGNKDAGQILKKLARNNYFVVRRLSRDIVYSYHPLFRQFLLERSKTIFSQQTITQIITEAASVLDKDGQVEEALSLISEVGNWETMTRF
ncbi:MAG: AAA family ATPase, partial [Deltaproteobacteria bacterium]|nr:AAA family ATPase [Deltaproteobacteria bacterium]